MGPHSVREYAASLRSLSSRLTPRQRPQLDACGRVAGRPRDSAIRFLPEPKQGGDTPR